MVILVIFQTYQDFNDNFITKVGTAVTINENTCDWKLPAMTSYMAHLTWKRLAHAG